MLALNLLLYVGANLFSAKFTMGEVPFTSVATLFGEHARFFSLKMAPNEMRALLADFLALPTLAGVGRAAWTYFVLQIALEPFVVAVTLLASIPLARAEPFARMAFLLQLAAISALVLLGLRAVPAMLD